MKKYIVSTQSAVNCSNLISTMIPNIGCSEKFETDSISEARAVFEKEVTALSAEYTQQCDLSYEPTDYEQSHSLFCEITCHIIDEDGHLSDVINIETSDYFYES